MNCRSDKKVSVKRFLSAGVCISLLLATMLLSVTGCKKNGDGSDGTGDNGVASGAGIIPDATNPDGTRHDYVLESDPYYTCDKTFIEFPLEEGQNSSDITTLDYSVKILRNHIAVAFYVAIPMPDDVKEEYERLHELQISGTPMSNDDYLRYYEIEAQYKDGGVAAFDYDGTFVGKLMLGSEDEICGYCSVGENEVAVLSHRYNFEEQQNEYWLRTFTSDGQCRNKVQLQFDSLLGGVLMEGLDDGNLLIVSRGDAYFFSLEGDRIRKTSFYLNGEQILHADGKYYILESFDQSFDGEVRAVLGYQEINIRTGELSERKDLLNYYTVVSVDGDSMYSFSGNSLTRLNLLTEEQEQIFSGNDNDFLLSSGESGAIRVFSDEDILYAASEVWENEGSTYMGINLYHIRKAATNPYAGRKIIRVGINQFKYTNLIHDYNTRPESKARILVYSSWTNTDMDSAFAKAEASMVDTVLLDMRSGTGPDVLMDFADFTQFDNDDVLVDLNPYLDGSTGIDRSLYYDNILRAFETDGKLYQIPLAVRADTLAGNPDYIGDVTDWTCEEFLTRIQSLGDEVLPLLSPSENDSLTLLLKLLSDDMSHYVDYSKYEANFDSDDFRKLLEISKYVGDKLNPNLIDDLMQDYDDMRYGSGYHSTEALVMEAGLCCVVPMFFSTLREFARYSDLCNDQVVILGWPTTGGRGYAAEAVRSIGISQYSECKEEAWDFVRYVLSAEVLGAGMGKAGVLDGISINREVEEASVSLTISYSREESERRNENGYDGPSSGAIIDEELGEAFLAKIEHITTAVSRPPAVFNIIREEAPAYFNGDRSAEDVSRIIQNRVTTLLAEQG